MDREEEEFKRFDQRVLAAQISDMKAQFIQLSKAYEVNIKSHTDRYAEEYQRKISQRDISEFRDYLDNIKKDNLERIKQFFEKKIETKGESFNYYDQDNQQQFEILMADRDSLHHDLKEKFEQNKLLDERKLVLIESTLDQFNEKQKLKLAFKAWKNFHDKKQKKLALNKFLDERLFEKTKTKCFFSWRNYCYKSAYETKSIKTSEYDIIKFNKNYLDIIQILKNEIQRTDDLISLQSEKKAQLAYSLSKNLMKTISSLSHEVLNLNQVAVQSKQQQQKEIADSQHQLAEMNFFITQKYEEIKSLKKNYADNSDDQRKENKISSANVSFKEQFVAVNQLE